MTLERARRDPPVKKTVWDFTYFCWNLTYVYLKLSCCRGDFQQEASVLGRRWVAQTRRGVTQLGDPAEQCIRVLSSGLQTPARGGIPMRGALGMVSTL
jgi:hypothetical protein